MREYTARECANELGITERTWYAWIAAGLVPAAPIERTGGQRGGKRKFWTENELAAGRQVAALRAPGRSLKEISRLITDARS